MEHYVEKIEAILDLDYSFSVGSYNEGEVSVFVDTYEVNEDPVGCMQEITSAVESEFPELVCSDTECHEMVVVNFKVREVEED